MKPWNVKLVDEHTCMLLLHFKHARMICCTSTVSIYTTQETKVIMEKTKYINFS